ncbi:hypothetical protein [Limisalsivibrio acetivorans]|uniref:hypothetical protein n=1 Tax=Limisalsivibrio acetivorans TaxID=1304888 RepID=UPI0003B73EE5|nr:hypothetical protein [Limisalsivibrio acetivorans]
MRVKTLALQETKLEQRAEIGRLSVHIDDRFGNWRIVSESADPYVIESGGVRLIATKLDFLFDDRASFEWFHDKVEEGFGVVLERYEDQGFNLDDIFDVAHIVNGTGEIIDIPDYVSMGAAVSR